MKMLEAKDFTNYQFVSNPVFSENGEACVFQVAQVEDGDSYRKTLWISKEGEAPVQLTSGKRDQFTLWENGNTVLFSSNRKENSLEGNTDFYRISVDGGEGKWAFSLPIPVSSMIKISDGKYAVLARVEMDRTDFFEKVKGEKDTWEAGVQVIEELPFWENGEGFTAGQRTRLFLFEEGKGISPISEKSVEIRAVKYHSETETLYYIGKDFEKIAQSENSLYEYSIKASTTKVFLEDVFEIQTLDFYENQIIFVGSDMKTHGLNENPKIFSFDTKIEKLTLLAEPDMEIGSCVGTDSSLGGGQGFKIVGSHLYFTAVAGFTGYLHKLSLESLKQTVLTAKGDSVTGFDVSEKTNELVISNFHDGKLAEIFWQSGEEKEWKQVTHLNDEFHQNHMYSIPEHHTFIDAENFEIDGWVMRPIQYDPQKKYPAILSIHGGPKSSFGEIYHHEMQLWANEGYFVIFCNPRGSDGKGDIFADIRGKYGTVDYEDLMQFTDEMLKLYPQIDNKRVGVTGGSYGGFMTNWIIGHTHRFKAAATQRSITNWVSKTYMSDIGYYFNVDQVLAEDWRGSSFDVEKLWNSSPLKYVHTAVTPTLIVHSDEDYRCTVPEGYQLFSALQLAGVETKLCVFHGENHELSRSGKPKNRLRRLNEILSWMNGHLK